MTRPIHLQMIKADETYYLDTDEEGTLLCFESADEAVREIEGMFNKNHSRSYEASMSAAINYLFFERSIITFKDHDEVKSILVMPLKLVRVGNVSGWFFGLECVAELAKPYFDNGRKPRLISDPNERDGVEGDGI